MPFTVKKLFTRIDLPEPEVTKHRFKVGISIKNCWWNSHFTNVPKIPEDGFLVCEYPDTFLPNAAKIAERYIKKYNLPVLKRKRRAING